MLFFLINQSVLFLSFLVVMLLAINLNIFRNLERIFYFIYALVILRGVIVLYVYFCSLINRKFFYTERIVYLRGFILYLANMNINRYGTGSSSLYLNDIYGVLLILLCYLLIVLFIVIRVLFSEGFSLRVK